MEENHDGEAILSGRQGTFGSPQAPGDDRGISGPTRPLPDEPLSIRPFPQPRRDVQHHRGLWNLHGLLELSSFSE